MQQSVSKTISAYLAIALGALIYCMGWTVFILPHHMVSGGVSGISAVIQYCTGFNMSYSYAIINTFLLLLSVKALGKGFGVRTIFAVALLSILLRVLPELISPEFIESVSLHNDKILCAIIGGGITGLGTSMMISSGGSSGGTDIVALLVCKNHNVSPGRVIMLLDIIIIASSLIIPAEGGWGARVATVVHGYVTAGVFTVTLDHILQSNRQCVQLFVFSKKYAEIADRINSEAHRGVSVISAEGWFSKSELKVLMVIVRKTELESIMAIVKREDDAAFTSVGNVRGVYGEGFDRIKA